MEIHAHGFLLLALMFIQNFARNPVLVNNRLSAASYLTQPLASNLAKSQIFLAQHAYTDLSAKRPVSRE
jgi:hypothetical protein